MLDFGEAVRRYYSNYTNADGRAQRSAYWWVLLYQLIIYAVLLTVIYMAEGGAEWFEIIAKASGGDILETDVKLGSSGLFAFFLAVVFALANFLPQIMLEIRRFHDLGQSGWLVLGFRLIGALPLIGNIAGLVNFVWFIFPGTAGGNRYGRDPIGHNPDIFG